MMKTTLKRGAVFCFLMVLMTGCSRSDMSSVCLRADLVPLKVMMTDYIFADGGKKLIKVEGSANYVVPLAAYTPYLDGKCYRYSDMPRPRLDMLSLRIDGQKLLINERGLFTSRSADSSRINDLRNEAMKKMRELAGDESFVYIAMANTVDALRSFYEKFEGYSCSIQWK